MFRPRKRRRFSLRRNRLALAVGRNAYTRRLAIGGLAAWERLSTGAVYNPFSPSVIQDPHPAYGRLQKRDPVHWSPLLRFWVVTRFDDVAALLRDRRFSSQGRARYGAPRAERHGEFAHFWNRALVRTDPPDHTRLRALVSRAFTLARVEAMRPRMVELAEEGLDGLAGREGEVELLTEFVGAYVATVIAEILGVPAQDHPQFRAWSTDLAFGIDPMRAHGTIRRANAATRELRAYFTAVVAERRRAPGEDFVSALLAAEEDGKVLNDDEVYAMLTFLLAAGNETTTNLIANTVHELLRHPDQLRLVLADPALVEGAVEETLRLTGSPQSTDRTAREDVVWKGKTFRAGQVVMPVLGAANVDPTRFERPLEFDVTRNDPRHLAFGQGPHFCLGAPLARAEARIAVGALLRRYPGIQLGSGRLQYRTSVVVRGLQRLPVRLS